VENQATRRLNQKERQTGLESIEEPQKGHLVLFLPVVLFFRLQQAQPAFGQSSGFGGGGGTGFGQQQQRPFGQAAPNGFGESPRRIPPRTRLRLTIEIQL